MLLGLTPEDPQSIALTAEELDGAIQRLHSPRSLAELRLSSACVRCLDEWALRLSAASAAWSSDIRSVSDSTFTRQQAFGLLFLALACETARRDASEGQVWAFFRRKLSAEAEAALFVQGQPKQATKDAIESACRYWRLRHVFGQEGTQAWSRRFTFSLDSLGARSRLGCPRASREQSLCPQPWPICCTT